jgi:hypothetical protein
MKTYKVKKTTWHGGQPQAPGTILELTNSEANLPLRQGKIALSEKLNPGKAEKLKSGTAKKSPTKN